MGHFLFKKESETFISITDRFEHRFGHFFKSPGKNWFYQPPNPARELTYHELRRLYNKLYKLNRKERLGVKDGI